MYNYAQGELLENPNTYQYSDYGGVDLLHTWRESRQKIQLLLGPPVPPPDPYNELTGYFSVNTSLENLMRDIGEGSLQDLNIKAKLDLWVKKFEISKRLFEEYDEQLKPVDKAKYHDLGAYVRYAEIMEKAYQQSGKLPYLNVLLKIMDTLIAYNAQLSDQLRSRLAWLIGREIEYVVALAGKKGVAI